MTDQKYRLVTSDKHIVLIGIGGPAGHWKSWNDAQSSLASSVQIVERAFLHLVLLGDNGTGKKRVPDTELELANIKEELEITKIERDFMKRAVRYYTRASLKDIT